MVSSLTAIERDGQLTVIAPFRRSFGHDQPRSLRDQSESTVVCTGLISRVGSSHKDGRPVDCDRSDSMDEA